MRAAASKVPTRARSWQSQRTTRRSLLLLSWGPFELAGIVFQPVPAHSGQSSAPGLVDFTPASSIRRNSIPFDDPFENSIFDSAPECHLPASTNFKILVYKLCRGAGAVEK